jgi:hypothetical protein
MHVRAVNRARTKAAHRVFNFRGKGKLLKLSNISLSTHLITSSSHHYPVCCLSVDAPRTPTDGAARLLGAGQGAGVSDQQGPLTISTETTGMYLFYLFIILVGAVVVLMTILM